MEFFKIHKRDFTFIREMRVQVLVKEKLIAVSYQYIILELCSRIQIFIVSPLFIVQPNVHRYLPHMQAEQQQAVACTRHIRASVEKKDLRKPEFPVPRKWLVGERSDNVIPAQMDGCSLYVFQCGNKII